MHALLMLLILSLASPEPPPPMPLVVVPDMSSATPDGWAGISYSLWLVAAGFSTDGRRYFACDPGDAKCRVIDVASGKRIAVASPTGTLDDSPDGVTTDPAIARLVRKYKVTTASGAWRRPDVHLTWALALGADGLATALTYSLTDDKGGEVVVARFTAPPVTDDLPATVVPRAPLLSPDGKTLALHALTQHGQTLATKHALVRVDRALAKLAAARQ